LGKFSRDHGSQENVEKVSRDNGASLASNSTFISRRSLVLSSVGIGSVWSFGGSEALAFWGIRLTNYRLIPAKNANTLFEREQVHAATTKGSEMCLLKLLPVKNPTYSYFVKEITGLSKLKSATRKFKEEKKEED